MKLAVIETVLSLVMAGTLQAQEPASPAAPSVTSEVVELAQPQKSAPKQTSRWFLRAGILRAHYNSGARIATNGELIPGSTAKVTDNLTASFDIGYDVSDKFAVMLMGGIPPKASVIGKGSVASFGNLGDVRFGPAILTGIYRLPPWHGVRPYVGAGGVHLFILKEYDGAVSQLKVHDHWGVALQAGAEFRVNRKWELYVDYKRLWLHANAEGLLDGAPVRARVALDPDLISAGIKVHFR